MDLAQSLKAIGVRPVAAALGIQSGRQNSIGPCPSCGATSRGRGDARLAVGLSRDGRGWHCQAKGCQAKGDPLDLVSFHVAGKPFGRKLSDSEREEIERVCVDNGWSQERARGRSERRARRSSGPRRPRARGASGPPPDVPDERPEAPQATSTEPRRPSPFDWHEGLAEECEQALWGEPSGRGADLARAFLRSRNIPEAVAREAGLGVRWVSLRTRGADGWETIEAPWLTIPLRDSSGRAVNLRHRSLPPAKKAYRVCPGSERPLPLFGEDLLSNDLFEVLVLEGELDVLAARAYGLRDVVSGTSGADTFRSEWFDALEHYERVLVGFDADEKGDEAAEKHIDEFRRRRCYRVRWPRKDLGEMREQGDPLDAVELAIERAESCAAIEWVNPAHFVDELLADYEDPQRAYGTPTGHVDLDRHLAGWEPGIVVWSGETGCGKTTTCVSLLWELAHRGVSVALVTMEDQSKKIGEKLLRLEVGGNPKLVSREEVEAARARLRQLPIRTPKFRPDVDRSVLFEELEHAVRRERVSHIMIDHLDFLVDDEARDMARDIRVVMKELRDLTYSDVNPGKTGRTPCTVHLIAHPTKIPESAKRVKINHIAGSAAIKQYAAVVLIVDGKEPISKRPWFETWIYVDKVRSDDGMKGLVKLAFGPVSLRLADTGQHEWLPDYPLADS